MPKNNKKYSLVLFKREDTEVNKINNKKRLILNKDISVKLRKNKLNIINSKDSNLPSTIFDSKLKEKNIITDNKIFECKTTINRENPKKEKIRLKGKQIKKINIENDNNIKFLKENLKKINTEEDLIENRIIDKNAINRNNNINDIKNDFISKNLDKNQIKFNKKIEENNYITLEKPKIHLYKKGKIITYNNTSPNSKYKISSFDKRKSYQVPKIKNKKKKRKEEIKNEKKKNVDLKKNTLEIKEILTSNLIRNKQIEYIKEYEKYMNDYNNKLFKNNEKKFRFIQEEGFELNDLFLDNNENKINTIDEIYEKEEGEEIQESI